MLGGTPGRAVPDISVVVSLADRVQVVGKRFPQHLYESRTAGDSVRQSQSDSYTEVCHDCFHSHKSQGKFRAKEFRLPVGANEMKSYVSRVMANLPNLYCFADQEADRRQSLCFGEGSPAGLIPGWRIDGAVRKEHSSHCERQEAGFATGAARKQQSTSNLIGQPPLDAVNSNKGCG